MALDTSFTPKNGSTRPSHANGGPAPATAGKSSSSPARPTVRSGAAPRAGGAAKTAAARPKRSADSQTKGATATRSSTASRKTSASRSTAAKRRPAAGGATTHRSASAGNGRAAAKRTTVDVMGDYAERALLIPVGAAMIASEAISSTVGGMIATYSSSSKRDAQIRRFERRGSTVRKRLERAARKRRTRVQRELRQRRRVVQGRSTRITKDLSTQVEQAQDQIEKTQSWLGDTLKARIDTGQDIAGRVQERVLSQV